MPGALLRASGAPAGQLCASSGLWVWSGWLCIGLGFWSAPGSAPAPSVSAAGAHWPLPGSSGSPATGVHEPRPGCLVVLLQARTSISLSALVPVAHGSALGPFRHHHPRHPLPLSHYWASVSESVPVGGTSGRLFSAMRGFRTALPPRGLGRLSFPEIPSCWLCVPRQLRPALRSVSLRLAESTHFSFVSWVLVVGTCPQVLLFRFSNIQLPVHLVSVFQVRISTAGCLAVLGFHSLPVATPFFPPGFGVGEHSGPAWLRLLSYPFHVMLSSRHPGCSTVSTGVSFRSSCIYCIFINIYVLGRRFPLNYSPCHLPFGPGYRCFFNNSFSL
ncbi:uncharacterized protein [Manis javanica]|uniref:uncharacterized protein n=1 Tax=Manis javanica TaxID=9974 RepID=UPI003C6DB097